MKRTFTFFFVAGMFCSSISFAQQLEKIYSVFTINFPKHIEWSNPKSATEFTIGIYGNSEVENELRMIAKTREIHSKKLVVKKLNQKSDFELCDVVYVSNDKSDQINEVKTYIKGKQILLITEASGTAQNDGGISFLTVENKIKFEINRMALESRGMKIGSALTALGIEVND